MNPEPPARRNLARLLALALVVVALAAAYDWLTVRTERIYVDELPRGERPAAELRQRFTVRDDTVTPEIAFAGATTFRVPVEGDAPRKLMFTMAQVSGATLDVRLHTAGSTQSLLSARADEERSYSIRLPRRAGELEFAGRGDAVLLDLRLVRRFDLAPLYMVLAAALGALLLRTRSAPGGGAEWLTLCGSTIVALVLAEFVLAAAASKLPGAVLARRTEFGLAGEDARLIDPQRYKLRLKPNLNTVLQWSSGDITRLGLLPKELAPAKVHRYSLRTDAEGFRNEAVRPQVDIAALGDSFTDATTGPAKEAWPRRLAEIAGRPVQNYGTSGFGPQQELYVLRDYVLPRQPRVVVLAFTAGNDIYDAEAFDEWERQKSAEPETQREGWRLRKTFRRYQTFYVTTVAQAAWEAGTRWLGREHSGAEGSGTAGELSGRDATPRFDRGMFTVRLGERAVQFAFLPPYLQRLAASRSEIEARRGWPLAQRALQEMRNEAASRGALFVLMFVPEKTQVYWPVVERLFPPEELEAVARYYAETLGTPVQTDQIALHRVAQNELLRDFCAREGIPMLDLTPALQRELEAGREVYFPDDTHWNAAGHEIAARELAQFLASRP